MWIAIFAAVLCFVLFQMIATPSQVERLDELPFSGPQYKGEAIRFDSSELRLLDGADAIKRIYTIDQSPFLVYVVDGTRNQNAVHEPSEFFLEGGWHIISQSTLPLEAGEGVVLTLQRNDESKEAIYWYTTGAMQHVSPWLQCIQSWMRRITLGNSNDEPLLVIVEAESPGTIHWNKTLNEFPELLTL